jgi:hypothetical protein
MNRRLAESNPTVTRYRDVREFLLKNIGLVQSASGRQDDARRSFEQALAVLEKLESASGLHPYFKAGTLAQLSELAGPGRRTVLADEAMSTLRQAVAAGYQDWFNYAGDMTLDPLRQRPDSQLMLRVLSFPDKPFAP